MQATMAVSIVQRKNLPMAIPTLCHICDFVHTQINATSHCVHAHAARLAEQQRKEAEALAAQQVWKWTGELASVVQQLPMPALFVVFVALPVPVL
jgi:hypothetical protein